VASQLCPLCGQGGDLTLQVLKTFQVLCCFKQALDEGLDDTLPGLRLSGRDFPGLSQRSLRPRVPSTPPLARNNGLVTASQRYGPSGRYDGAALDPRQFPYAHVTHALDNTTFLKSIFLFFPVQVLDKPPEPNLCRIYGVLA
jgi:hypothetical protein